jgi:hypothetical protein
MGLGIIEPKGSPDGAPLYVPGTAPLFDKAPHQAGAKHADGTNGSLILVPQPSDDPNDPLVRRLRLRPPPAATKGNANIILTQNWPRWKKEMCFFALVYNIMMGAVLAPILANVGGPLVKEFGVTFPQYTQLSGWPLFTTGISASK